MLRGISVRTVAIGFGRKRTEFSWLVAGPQPCQCRHTRAGASVPRVPTGGCVIQAEPLGQPITSWQPMVATSYHLARSQLLLPLGRLVGGVRDSLARGARRPIVSTASHLARARHPRPAVRVLIVGPSWLCGRLAAYLAALAALAFVAAHWRRPAPVRVSTCVCASLLALHWTQISQEPRRLVWIKGGKVARRISPRACRFVVQAANLAGAREDAGSASGGYRGARRLPAERPLGA